MSDTSDLSLEALIEQRVREALGEMKNRPPRDREALAGTVERLLKAKPYAGGSGVNLYDLLKDLEKGPSALQSNDD